MDWLKNLNDAPDLGLKVERDVILGPYNVPKMDDPNRALYPAIPQSILDQLKDSEFFVEFSSPVMDGLSGEALKARMKTIQMSRVCARLKITNYFTKKDGVFDCLYFRAHLEPYGPMAANLERLVQMNFKLNLSMRYMHKKSRKLVRVKHPQKKTWRFYWESLVTQLVTWDIVEDTRAPLVDPLNK